jgi:hypothetical protein
MVAVAKNEPYVGFTLKAILATMIQEGSTLKQIESACAENFPRKFGKPVGLKKLPKILSKLLRLYHRGKLKFDLIKTEHVAPPESLVTIKGVEFVAPKAYLKASKPSKGKASAKVVSVADDEAEEPAAKPSSKLKAKSKPVKGKPAKAKGKATKDDDVEDVE